MIAPPHRDHLATEDATLARLRDRLRTTLDFDVTALELIVTGYTNNNRLWRLRAADGRSVIAKLYYRDDRRRLEREFDTLRFLHTRGMAGIPTPILRDDGRYAAVYSDEAGVMKRSAELTTGESAMAGRFLAELHGVGPDDPGATFPLVFNAADTLDAKVAAIRQRLRLFLAAAADPAASPQARALYAEMDVTRTLERLLEGATLSLDAAAMAETFPIAARRLDSGDFAPHNFLFRPDGSICVLDFEYAGWDQPLLALACFLTAATSLDLSPAAVGAFLQSYFAAMGNDDAATKLCRFCALQHLFWCGVHLSSTTPAYLERKRFANPGLADETVIAAQISQFKRRLALAEAAIARLHGDPQPT